MPGRQNRNHKATSTANDPFVTFFGTPSVRQRVQNIVLAIYHLQQRGGPLR